MVRDYKFNSEPIESNIYKTKNYGNVRLLLKDGQDYTVEFLDYNNEIRKFKDSSFREGSMKPYSKTKTYNIGNLFVTNENYTIKIIEKIDYEHYIIEFQDEHKFKMKVNRGNINSGKIKNPYHRSVYGIGFYGDIGIVSDNNLKSKIYDIWAKILNRCYNEKDRHKNPSYKNVTVCEEWHNFSNFYTWYKDNYPYHIEDVKFELDKDLLQIGLCDKIYSSSTCCFLPKAVNIFLTYKPNRCSEFLPKKNIYCARIRDFNTKKEKFIGYYNTKEEGDYNVKLKTLEKIEDIKEYLRNLNYLNDDIISLIGSDTIV